MNLYLIAHKVRGEAAFDVALRCDDMGTESDPGPWWIIPTSGHRAYPILAWTLDNLPGNVIHDITEYSEFAGLPDHYAQVTRHEPAQNSRINPRKLLEALGLAKPVTITRRL